MTRVLVFMFVLATTVYAVMDCINAEEEDRRGLPTGLWLILIIMLPIFGPVSWYLVSSSQRRARMAAGGSANPRPTGGNAGGYGRPSQRPQRPARPVAPDDDPDFLWHLEQERRRAARDEKRQNPSDQNPSGEPPSNRNDSGDDATGEEPPKPDKTD